MAAAGNVRHRIASIFRQRSKLMARPRPDCFVTVNCTLNNTHVCFATSAGKVITTSSAGAVGFKGPERSSREGAVEAARVASERAKDKGFTTVDVRFKGPAANHGAALTSVLATGFQVVSMEDITGFPTNGCRPRKTRRL